MCAALRKKKHEASLSELLRSGAGAGAVDQQLALEVRGGVTCLTRPVCAHVNGAPIPDALARLRPGASYGSKSKTQGLNQWPKSLESVICLLPISVLALTGTTGPTS